MGILTSLDAVQQADHLVDSMRLGEELAFEASRDGGARIIRVLASALVGDDQVAAIAATHALAAVVDGEADATLARLLSDDRRFLREHAAWALGSRIPRSEAVGRLIGMVAEGGFGSMIAQRTLEQWASLSLEHVAIGLEGALLGIDEPGARYRVVETLGLVRSQMVVTPLVRIAAHASENETVRAAAVSALGQRQGDRQVEPFLRELASGDTYLAAIARLSLADFTASRSRRPVHDGPLTVAQLFLHADIDAELTHAGSGDNGGIATLLVRLGNALVAPRSSGAVGRVITLSRGSADRALLDVDEIAATPTGHMFGRIPTLSEPVQSASSWPLRVAVRRGIRRMLRAAGDIDVLHLRMADVGSLAAADVARELEIPVVFTVAPDPHAVIDSLDKAGRLTRWNFGDVDENEHFWFRARLVQRLAANASHTVLFPRPRLQQDMKDLVGIDITAHPERHTVVPEGIDLEVVDRAAIEAAEGAAGNDPSDAIEQLRDLLTALPAERRGLPLLVSVGRFHRVKGMSTIVEAWARGPLADRANLLLIGGELENPSADEREQLDAMNQVVPEPERIRQGLILAGHRRNDTVARWVAAVRFGIPGLAAPRGVYVCGSLKEEFGIALLEAMASGLMVVAPNGGGPATYVTEGVTGYLTPTWDVGLLASAMATALDASLAETGEERAAQSRDTVALSFTIGAMAASLTEVYTEVNAAERALQDWVVAAP
jgi:glycosyltransferase involved in cell wall biosynthesis